MNISKADIFRGCLISSIMHAIKVNEYPELSYEQSWDGDNFSMQNSAGLRGTISFCPDFCIGAIRNDDDVNLDVKCDIQLKLEGFPSYVAQKAKKETLQYLLIDNNGIVVPYATTVFWADDNIHFEKGFIDKNKQDLLLFENIMLPEIRAIEKWKNYYEMDSNAMQLFDCIYSLKMKNFNSKIVLSPKQIKLIPGNSITSECLESLAEINVFV